jgi:hypothetical protein
MGNSLTADFCIAIDFEKGSEAPSRVFRALSDIIDSFHALDKDLIQSIDSKIEPIILLEDIESGSIKTWLRYIFNDEASFNLQFKIVPELIEDLLTKERLEACMQMILKVKKPDYLGESKWEFKHENKTIPMKILDIDWLKAFQNREIDIRPGDSIRAEVQIITNRNSSIF